MPISETFLRRQLRKMYIANHSPIPTHLLAPTEPEREAMASIWQRYEAEKQALPPMPPEEYERELRFISEKLGI